MGGGLELKYWSSTVAGVGASGVTEEAMLLMLRLRQEEEKEEEELREGDGDGDERDEESDEEEVRLKERDRAGELVRWWSGDLEHADDCKYAMGMSAFGSSV